MKFALAMLSVLLVAVPALAEDYEKGTNGGLQLDVAGIDAELLTSGKTVTINVFDPKNAKPVATKGYSASVLIVSGASREPLTLAPSGDNSLKGEAKNALARMRRSRSTSRPRPGNPDRSDSSSGAGEDGL